MVRPLGRAGEYWDEPDARRFLQFGAYKTIHATNILVDAKDYSLVQTAGGLSKVNLKETENTYEVLLSKKHDGGCVESGDKHINDAISWLKKQTTVIEPRALHYLIALLSKDGDVATQSLRRRLGYTNLNRRAEDIIDEGLMNEIVKTFL